MNRRLPSLNGLKAFEAAARCGSFTLAAKSLFVTQSAVSRQVKLLEEALGQPLLIRGHHKLDLTPTGRELLPVLHESFDRIEAVVQDIREGVASHRLRINVPPTFARCWLLPRIQNLRQRHPDLVLTIRTQAKDTLAVSNELDCAIRFGSGDWEDLHSSHLLQEQHIAVAAPDLAGPDQARVNLDGLALLHVLKKEGRYMTWQHWFAAAGLPEPRMNTSIDFDTLNLAIQAAVEGVGVTIADRNMITRELAQGQLVMLLDTIVPGTESYWLVKRSKGTCHPAVEAFECWLREQLPP